MNYFLFMSLRLANKLILNFDRKGMNPNQAIQVPCHSSMHS
jgi:hypothetical protein